MDKNGVMSRKTFKEITGMRKLETIEINVFRTIRDAKQKATSKLYGGFNGFL